MTDRSVCRNVWVNTGTSLYNAQYDYTIPFDRHYNDVVHRTADMRPCYFWPLHMREKVWVDQKEFMHIWLDAFLCNTRCKFDKAIYANTVAEMERENAYSVAFDALLKKKMAERNLDKGPCVFYPVGLLEEVAKELSAVQNIR